MGKIYLVDSENVGDIWVPLLVSSQEDDEVLVFYTTKSPHMNYENVRMLKETEKEADFIKCFEEAMRWISSWYRNLAIA